MENKKTTAIALAKEDALNQVTSKIADLKKNNEIIFPKNYSVANAVNSAWLLLQEVQNKEKKPALEVCTRNSIMGCLYDMCLQGLSPAKKQCYFVVYGNQLQLMRSYMGTVAVTKRLRGIEDVKAYVIYEGDEFEQEYDETTATLKISKYAPKFENIDIDKIKGAFAVIVGENGPIHVEVMNIKQIETAWAQRYGKPKSDTHIKFAEEMAKKTVVNRACKMYANTSDDSDLLIGAFNNTDILHEKSASTNVQHEVEKEIKEKANTKLLDIETQKNIVDIEAIEVKPQQSKMEGLEF